MNRLLIHFAVIAMPAFFVALSGYANNIRQKFPYTEAGLTERQAAAHLLSRFSYGGNKADLEALLEMGLEAWFSRQLRGDLPDRRLDQLLQQYKELNLTNAEVEEKFPRGGKLLRMAVRDGAISKDSVSIEGRKAYREKLQAYMKLKGFMPQQQLYRQFISQKVLRAAYSNNQLHEVLTEFWFNHFNVSLTKGQSALYTPAYERDVIRPNVAGRFSDLLLATAQSPAMLIYLDNSTSSASGQGEANRKNSKRRGLNENYAREVMELHALGVDGGYTQHDVTQAARVLTGWTVRNGKFYFAAARHDNREKIVLGRKFPANGGVGEGIAMLNLFAHHKSTARFITRKIAVRFVSDDPSQSLLDKMYATFVDTNGDLSKVMLAMVYSPEFWSNKSVRQKTKSPFELAMSAVRSLDASIKNPYALFNWVNKMGQKIYYYQAPTGFPDQGEYWINTGALLSRMNFGLALATQKVPGVRVNLSRLNGGREPEHADAALIAFCDLILPEREMAGSLENLKPLVTARQLSMADNQQYLGQVVGVIIGSPEFQRR